ncbi:hypothetical protein GGF31_000403 [Allomyces arbusculus]|nr:hypothetical protein GGF31_000403 [Allomyces arbusculus]
MTSAAALGMLQYHGAHGRADKPIANVLDTLSVLSNDTAPDQADALARDAASPPPPPPLLYDLIRVQEWVPGPTSAATLATPAPWLPVWCPSTASVAVLADDSIELVRVWDHAQDTNAAAATPQPDPWVSPAASPFRHAPLDRRGAWSRDGHVLAVALATGTVLLFADVGSTLVQVLELCPAKITPSLDPLAFVHVARASDDARAPFHVLTVSRAGRVRLVAVDVPARILASLVSDETPLWSPDDTMSSLPDGMSVSVAAQWDAAPYLATVHDAAWHAHASMLYLTGRLHDDDQSTRAPVPLLALRLELDRGCFDVHPDVPTPTAPRTAGQNRLLRAVSSLATGLVGRSAPQAPPGSENSREGVQISLWSTPGDAATLEDARILLRDSHGHLRIVDGHGTHIDRYDAGFLKLVHHGHPVAHAAWWDRPTAPSADDDEDDLSPRTRGPSIVTVSTAGLVMVHSFPEWTPVSDAEQFNVPVLLSHVAGGRSCLLDCELTWPRTAIATRAAPPQRSLVTRALRSVTNTFLWHFDDDDEVQAAQQGPVGPNRKWTLWDWRPLTAAEMLVRKLTVDRDYQGALDMARAHGMATDVVYQTQWLHLQEREQQQQGDHAAAITPASVTAILGQVTDTIWVLRACAETVPRDPTAARALLVHGLQLTESMADAVRRAAAESATEPDLAVLVEFRLTLLRLLDRLELFTRIHLPSTTDRHLHHPAYIRLRSQNLVHVAIEYARAGHVAAVGTLLAVLTPLAAFRLRLCAELPAFLDPDLYASLLPGQSAAAKVHHWRSNDWCEAAEITRWVGWMHDWDAAASLRDPPAASLADWFAQRARRIEAETGCADTALRVLDLAVDRGIAEVEALRVTMRQFAWLVYACGTADWSSFSLAEFESAAPEHVLKRVIDRAVAVVSVDGAEVGENAWLLACINEFLVPFVDARRAHVALLSVLAPWFESRPQLVLAVLAADDIWWGNNGLAAKGGDEETDDLDVQFAHKVLGMAYAVAAVDDAWIDLLGQLFEQLPNLNDDEDEKVPPTPTPKLHRRRAAWHAIQTFEAYITAAETFAHVGLYLSPSAFDAISRGTAAAEPRDQRALLRELFRRAPATAPATVEWVFDAIHDLLEMRFFHMPKEDVYAAALRYALGGLNAKFAVMAADMVGRGEVVTRAVAEVAGEMADQGKFGDAVECLSLIPFVNVDADLAHYSALKLLHAHRVPNLSRHLTRDELLARAVAADVSRDVLVAAGCHFGYSPIKVSCVLLQHTPNSRAAATLADSLIRQVTTAAELVDPATLALVCTTLMDAARRVPDQAASLVRFCVDHAPADQLPAVLDRWREMQRDTRPPPPAAAHDAVIVEKRVAPIYVDLARATRADMDAWLTTPPITPIPASTPEAQFRTARSLHAALAVVPQCDPARVDAQFHALVLYAVGKQALRGAVPTDVKATDIVDSGMPVADELAVLAGRVPDHAVAIAREMEALEHQAVRHRLAQIPSVDVERFLGSKEYQGRVVGELMRNGEWELVQVLAEHVQLGSAELVGTWVRANAEAGEAVHDRPRAVATWVGKVKEGGEERVAEVVREMARVLEQDSTTVYGHALVYDLYAQLCPAHVEQCRVRQKVIATFLPLQLPGWSTPAAIHRYLAGSMEYFRAFFQLAVTSQTTYTSLRGAIASLQDLEVLPDLDRVAPGSTLVQMHRLVSCLSAVRVHAVIKEDAALATPLPRSRVATGHGSPTQAEGSPRLRSFFGLGSPTLPFASLHSTAPAPADPLLQIVTLLRDVDLSDLALFHDDLVAHLCRRLTVARLDTIESAVRAMDAAFPARQSNWSFLWRAAGILRSVQSLGVRSCSFMDHVTTDPPTLAVQQLLLQGVAVASIECTYADLVTVYTAATPYVAPRAADARPPPPPFAAALEASLRTILMSGSDVAPLVAAMTRAPASATRLFMHVVAEVAPQMAAPLADMLDDTKLKCQVLAAAALTGIGTAAFDLDLDAIHERWVAQCAEARSPGPHEERVACVCAWHAVTEVPVNVWVREAEWVQSVPVPWVVAFRAQVGELSLETEEAMLTHLDSTPHRVAFCLASTHLEILHHGISLLTPLPRDDDDGDSYVDVVDLSPFVAALPLVRARRDLASLAARWPTWNVHVPSAPLVTEHLQLHPLLLAQALVGQIRLDRCARPPRPAWSRLRLQMSDGDLCALVESRYGSR